MLEVTIRIIQGNVNQSSQATETILELGVSEKADIILLQEPWIHRSREEGYTRSINHGSFIPIRPEIGKEVRPRVLAYQRQESQIQVSLDLNSDPDIQSLIIKDNKGGTIQVLNVYNEKNKLGEWTVERALYTLSIRNIAILAGDFNIRHPSWDPNGRDNSIRAREFLDWIEKNDFLLRNVQGTPTFYRSHLTNPSVLDLTFTKGGLSRLDIGWATTEVGSDHSAILYRVVGRQDRQT